MKLSIIILNYNVRYFLELCLWSVKKSIKDIDAEIIVVDNNSTDDSCQMVKELFPEVILIENDENLGFSKGNNIGVSKASGKYLCILNPDTVVPENVFVELLTFADSKENVGAVGCQLIDGAGLFLPESKRNIPTPKVALQKILGSGNSYYSNLNKNEVGKAEILVGAFMLIKKSIYDEVNGFDEDYFMYGEDIDISYKILKKGYENYYFGNASVIHFKGESTLKNKTYAKHFYGAMSLFYKKHFKTNVFVDGLVLLGIKFVSAFSKNKEAITKDYTHAVVFSKETSEALHSKINYPIEYSGIINNIEDESFIIINSKDFSYSEIIDFLKSTKNYKNSSVRIWPEGRNFILGSDTSAARGEVIKF